LAARFGGSIEVRGESVVVLAPEFSRGSDLHELVEVILEAPATLAAAATKGRVDVRKLPDRQVLPGGALL
jgi:hypothetical protein